MSSVSSSPVSPERKTGPLTGKAKLDDVARLLGQLKEDLTSSQLQPGQRIAALEQLRIYGRDPKDAEPIFTQEGIEILTKHGLERDPSPSSLEALRCLANAMLLNSQARQIFVNLGYSGKAAERLKEPDSDYEFLLSRILFLTTYGSNLDFDALFDNHALGESINAHIARHATQFTKGGNENPFNPVDQNALSESLKLLFNISNFYPHRTSAFTPSIENIFKILEKLTIPHPPLQTPINYLINALVNLDLEASQASPLCSTNPIFPVSNPNANVDKLVSILNQSVSVYRPVELESLAVPLLTVLRKIYEFAPEGPRHNMQRLLLPEAEDRDLPLGQSDTLSSRLLRLSTAATATHLREGISSLMFELSGKDARSFVRNVGYGFAAGFLLSHDIKVPESVMEAQYRRRRHSGRDGAEEAERDGGDSVEDEGELINPVTGQRLSKESTVDTEPEMTTEEKFREAERLFVLFERLRATGVVSVQNPLKEAVESGSFERVGDAADGGNESERIEELDDSTD